MINDFFDLGSPWRLLRWIIWGLVSVPALTALLALSVITLGMFRGWRIYQRFDYWLVGELRLD